MRPKSVRVPCYLLRFTGSWSFDASDFLGIPNKELIRVRRRPAIDEVRRYRLCLTQCLNARCSKPNRRRVSLWKLRPQRWKSIVVLVLIKCTRRMVANRIAAANTGLLVRSCVDCDASSKANRFAPSLPYLTAAAPSGCLGVTVSAAACVIITYSIDCHQPSVMSVGSREITAASGAPD